MRDDDLSTVAQVTPECEPDLLAPLLRSTPIVSNRALEALPIVATTPVVGELVALIDGDKPVVRWPGCGHEGARRARSIVDLGGEHIGCEVLVVFHQAQVERPIIVGVLRDTTTSACNELRTMLEFEADGERVAVRAKGRLVLSCGEASITLTAAGKVLIRGTYVLSQSSGRNRMTGGSIDLN